MAKILWLHQQVTPGFLFLLKHLQYVDVCQISVLENNGLTHAHDEIFILKDMMRRGSEGGGQAGSTQGRQKANVI